ncbi:Hypothetical predicted protein [Lecanosticta acicola]|uniref:Uncharacterized protein n=1 Tax=Lecanosticta acicola TaxID=111012 RepID=A0AAI8YZ74_9PEZI|nr:Hypothetical predicted protein [Lecanosticta acicola]
MGIRWLSTPQRILPVLLILILVLVFHLLDQSPAIFIRGDGTDNDNDDHAQRPPKNLHFLVPASSSNANLCKLMVSAAILAYPSPAILNWDAPFDDPNLVEAGSHVAKITGAHEYLQNLDASHDEDIVLMVDGHDVWMQLRPQVLIDRFHEINRQADARTRKELGKRVVQRHGLKQKIVMGSQKGCWPWTFNDPPCYAVPTSPLPEDVYGPETDTEIKDGLSPYQKYSQRFLNSGVMVGELGAMRKLFAQAMEQLKAEPNIGSDQYIFSHILGDQQIYRETLLNNIPQTIRKYKQWNKELSPSDERIRTHLHEVREKAAARGDKSFEFGIGVDHTSLLGLDTVFAEDDTEWLHFNDSYQLSLAQQEKQLPSTSNPLSLNKDIQHSLPPFWTFTTEPFLPSRKHPWSQTPLFTNIYTGITPAAIHHNAHRGDRETLRETWWDKTWYFPHLRTLYDVAMYTPTLPVAFSNGREWWPYETWKGGGRNGISGPGNSSPGAWIPFEDLCVEHHEEVFRDGMGRWRRPQG